MNGSDWLNRIKKNIKNKSSQTNYTLSKFDLNQVDWNENDLKVDNKDAKLPFFITYTRREKFDKHHPNEYIKRLHFQFFPNDPILIKNAEFFSTLENTDIEIDEVDALYANEMALSIDELLGIITRYLEKKNKTDVQEINDSLQKLRDFKPRFKDVLKGAVASNLEVLQTGEVPDRNTMIIQALTEVDVPDSEINLEGTDIILKRDGTDQLLFKTEALGLFFKSNSFYRELFEQNLEKFKSYFNESMGSEATMFFAAMDTHFAKSNMSESIKYNYDDIKYHSYQYTEKQLTKESLAEFLVGANSLLLRDIFIQMRVYWGNALYGREFLNLIYKDALTEMGEILNEIMTALNNHNLKYAIDKDSPEELLDTFRSVFDYGPFFIKMKHKILDNTVQLAEAYFEAKKDDPKMQRIWKNPTEYYFMHYFFVYHFWDGRDLEINDYFTQTNEPILEDITFDKS